MVQTFEVMKGKKPDYFPVDPVTGKQIGGSIDYYTFTRRMDPSAREYRPESKEWKIISSAERMRWQERAQERELAEKRAEVARKVPTDVKYYLTKEGTKLYWKGEPPAHIKERIVSEISKEEYKYAKVKKPEIREKEYFVRPVGEPSLPWTPRKELKGLVTLGEVPRPIEPMFAPKERPPIVFPMPEISIPLVPIKKPKVKPFISIEKRKPIIRLEYIPPYLKRKAEFERGIVPGLAAVGYIGAKAITGAVKAPLLMLRPKTYVEMVTPSTYKEMVRQFKLETPLGRLGMVSEMVGTGYVGGKIVGVVAKPVTKVVARKLAIKRAKVKIAEPSEIVWYRKLPKGKELVEARGKIAIQIGKKPYKVDVKGVIAGVPVQKGLQKVFGKYQFQVWKPRVKKPIPAEAVLKGYTKKMKALYRAEVKVKGAPPVKMISVIKAEKIAEIRGLKEYAFVKQVWYPKRLERIGVGILREKMIAPFGKGERVYALYYAEEIGGRIVKRFEKPSITVKKMLVSKKAQLMLKPPKVIAKPKEVRPPLISPIRELAKRAAVEVHIAKIKPIRIPVPVFPRIPVKIIKPITKLKPIVKPIVTPILRVKPILKIKPIMKVTPITKVIPITKVTPTLKITPIAKVTPIVKVAQLLKVTPIMKITPVTRITPIEPIPPPTPLFPPIIIPRITKPRIRKKKKKKIKRLRRPIKYRPSLVGIRMKRHIMKEPKHLTGLEVREILI